MVLVTGASRGIGKEVARQLAACGASVLVSARDADHARAAAKEISVAGDVRASRSTWTSPTTPACTPPLQPSSTTPGAWTS